LKIPEYANKKIVAALTVAALTAALSCVPRTPKRPPVRRPAPVVSDSLTVFFTGATLGRLKPCGCSGGQLGGLERRPAVFDNVPVEKRMLIDTGSFIETDSEQDLIKFDIIIESLSLLDYQAVNLSERDFEMVRNRGLLGHPGVRFISAYGTGDEVPVGFQNRYLLGAEHVTISVLTFDVDRAPLEQISEGFVRPEEGDKTVNILIVNRCDENVISSITSLGIVDCIVCPSEAEEPMISGSPNKRPLVFSVGRYGRYISSLKIEKARVRDRFNFEFTAIPVVEELAKDPGLVDLYKGYQQMVKDSNLLEKHPRYVFSDGLAYVGSQACKDCHQSEYDKWKQTGHGRAYATLEKVGSQFDPECVACHVVGLDYQSGFVSLDETPEKKDVGCENCHGPGSRHVKTFSAADITGPQSTCLDCHTPEHSGEYAGNERVFQQKIIHWTEPNSPGNVK